MYHQVSHGYTSIGNSFTVQTTTPPSSPVTPNLQLPVGSNVRTPNSIPAQNIIPNYINILRWVSDGQLHPVEFFIRKYGGDKVFPPAEWNQAPNNLRIDSTDGEAYDILSFIDEYGGSHQFPPGEWLSSSAAPARFSVPAPPFPHHNSSALQLPWGDDLKTPTSLFHTAPPVLKYPTGSLDENINAHFVRSAFGYLRSSTYVRDVIDWAPRPHPFYNYKPLTVFITKYGFPNFVFQPD